MNAMKLEDIPGVRDMEPFKELTPDELADTNLQDLQYSVTQIQDSRGNKPNLGIIEEYQAKVCAENLLLKYVLTDAVT
jgi:hypothetical protein